MSPLQTMTSPVRFTSSAEGSAKQGPPCSMQHAAVQISETASPQISKAVRSSSCPRIHIHGPSGVLLTGMFPVVAGGSAESSPKQFEHWPVLLAHCLCHSLTGRLLLLGAGIQEKSDLQGFQHCGTPKEPEDTSSMNPNMAEGAC